MQSGCWKSVAAVDVARKSNKKTQRSRKGKTLGTIKRSVVLGG